MELSRFQHYVHSPVSNMRWKPKSYMAVLASQWKNIFTPTDIAEFATNLVEGNTGIGSFAKYGFARDRRNVVDVRPCSPA